MTRYTLFAAVAAPVLAFAATADAQQVIAMPDSVNNRLVLFSPVDGSVVNPNFFTLQGGTPQQPLQVGDEIWITEQIGDRIGRWSLDGTLLGNIGGQFAGGGLDNIRGLNFIGDEVYVANAGTLNDAPGNAIVRISIAGSILGNIPTAGTTPSPWHVLPYGSGQMLVSSSQAADDIHRYTAAGTSLGTFHDTTSLNFAQQLAYASNGDILAAGFSSNNIVRLNPTTGALISSFTASGARGVFQLDNGNILFSNSSGASVFNVSTGGSTLVYSGGGRLFNSVVIPEPGTAAIMAVGAVTLLRRRRV